MAVDGTIESKTNYVEEFANATGGRWPNLAAARASAVEVREVLSGSLAEKFGAFSSGDTDLLAFGSLARLEWTSGSDVDWTLLLDGQATPDHRTFARELAARIPETEFRGKKLPKPGTEGIFGSMASSHDIIHHIGGQADTNRNTTQRVLLLLEAYPIRHKDHSGDIGPYERVTRNILFCYLHDDTNFATKEAGSRIPRFLLNDVIRYWRTMCVDFAYKEWEQAGSCWALRNVKLRMSRKMLFVSALLMTFSCYKNATLQVEVGNPNQYLPMMQEHLMNFVRSSPMDIVVWAFRQLGLDDLTRKLLDCYEQFIATIDSEEIRKSLRDAKPQEVYNNENFLRLRDVSHEFQDVLSAAFFRAETELREFTAMYGIF